MPKGNGGEKQDWEKWIIIIQSPEGDGGEKWEGGYVNDLLAAAFQRVLTIRPIEQVNFEKKTQLVCYEIYSRLPI